MTHRTAGAFVFGAFVGGWFARAVLKWVLNLSGTWAIVLILAAAAGCGLVCAVLEVEGRRKTSR